MKNLVLILIVLLFSCISEEERVQYIHDEYIVPLENAGMTNIQLTDRHTDFCPHDTLTQPSYRTFTAIIDGRQVSGAVCYVNTKSIIIFD